MGISEALSAKLELYRMLSAKNSDVMAGSTESYPLVTK